MSVVSKIPTEVFDITRHTETLCSLVLRPLIKVPDYKAGQFLHLSLEAYNPSYGWPESRIFSIANSPTRKEYIRLTFNVKGKFTQQLYDKVNKGDILWVKMPYGDFVIDDNVTEIILIAGGTGITPFISFLQYVADKSITANISLYYGIKSIESLLFRDVIDECENKIAGFKFSIYIEEQVNAELLKHSIGKLDIKKIYKSEKKTAHYYLSGPVEMINNFQEFLYQNKMPQPQIHVDYWC